MTQRETSLQKEHSTHYESQWEASTRTTTTTAVKLVLKIRSGSMNSVDIMWRLRSETVLCLGQSTLI